MINASTIYILVDILLATLFGLFSVNILYCIELLLLFSENLTEVPFGVQDPRVKVIANELIVTL